MTVFSPGVGGFLEAYPYGSARPTFTDLTFANGESTTGLAVVPASFSLQTIIRLRQRTGHPVLLSEDGRIVGVCGETEIIRALAGSRH